MQEPDEATDAGTTIEEMSEGQAAGIRYAGEFEIKCEYCGAAVYFRTAICPSCNGTVASMENI